MKQIPSQTYSFDQVVDRRGTNCLKYDFAEKFGKPEDVIPLWVADMDFITAPGIVEKLTEIAERGIYGYSDTKADYFAAVFNWYRTRFHWEVKSDWLVKTPGVVFALAMAVRAFTNEGDAVLIQQPVYHPFANTILNNKRKLVVNPLKLVDAHYEIDFEDFEQKIIEHQVKLFILCNPHNPVGRVWKEWELKKLGDICKKHQILVISDEIHSDFIYEGHTHHMFASVMHEYEEHIITCTAPSKTFNLAGLQISNIFIPDQSLKQQFVEEMYRIGCEEVSVMGMYACQAAYETGAEWLDALKVYLGENLAFMRKFVEENLPKVHIIEPEGTYLVWLDLRELGMTKEERENFLLHKAKIWLNAGEMFGEGGSGFERVNIACPRATLKRALEQLKQALEAYNR